MYKARGLMIHLKQQISLFNRECMRIPA